MDHCGRSFGREVLLDKLESLLLDKLAGMLLDELESLLLRADGSDAAPPYGDQAYECLADQYDDLFAQRYALGTLQQSLR